MRTRRNENIKQMNGDKVGWDGVWEEKNAQQVAFISENLLLSYPQILPELLPDNTIFYLSYEQIFVIQTNIYHISKDLSYKQIFVM